MNKIASILFVIFLSISSCPAYSQSKLPVPENKKHEHTDTAKTVKNPSNPIPSLADTKKADSADKPSDHQGNPNRVLEIIGGIQAIIFLFQLFIFSQQSKRLKQTIESSERMERPYLFIEKIPIRKRDMIEVPNSFWISFIWRNVGRMPALIKGCVFKIEDVDTLPPIPDYTNASPLNTVCTVAANETFTTNEFGPAPEKGIKNGKPIQFIIYGKLTYAELNGKIHHTGFAIEVSQHLPACRTYNKDAYEWHD
jgi:hypothetical protein